MTDDLRNLGSAIKARREELGLSQMDVWKKRGGPSSTKVGDLEAGKPPSPSSSTKRKLEKALAWEAGSVEALLQGGTATPGEPPVDPNVRQVHLDGDELSMYYVAPPDKDVPVDEMRQLEECVTATWHFARIVTGWSPQLQAETDAWAKQALSLFSRAVQARLQPLVDAMADDPPVLREVSEFEEDYAARDDPPNGRDLPPHLDR